MDVKKAESKYDIKIYDNAYLCDEFDVFEYMGIDIMHTLYERYYYHFWNTVRCMLNNSGKGQLVQAYYGCRYAMSLMSIIDGVAVFRVL